MRKNGKIVACLDVKDGYVVKGVQFESVKAITDPVKAGLKYVEAGIDELVYYDISATNESRALFMEPVKELARRIDIPFTVGGGIRSIEDIEGLFALGVDKVSINSAAIKNPDLIRKASEAYGSERIMAAIDGKRTGDGGWHVYLVGGSVDTGMDVIEWAKELERLGAGELCMNSIDEDGVRSGYDLELLRILSKELTIPVIASGGAGEMVHFREAFEAGAASALAASVFHFGIIQIPELKRYLSEGE